MNSIKAIDNGCEDLKINTKIKISSLWTSVTLCYLYGDYFELYVPGKTSELVNGENLLDSPLKLFSATVLLVIPPLMVFLSIILRARMNQRLNLILGIFYTAIMLLIAATSLTPWRMFYVFLAVVESIISGLIVYYAWRWLNQK